MRFWRRKKEQCPTPEKEQCPTPEIDTNSSTGKVSMAIQEGVAEKAAKEAIESFVKNCAFKLKRVKYTATTLYGTDLMDIFVSISDLPNKMADIHKEAFKLTTSGHKKTVIYTLFNGEDVMSIVGFENDGEARIFSSKEGYC